MELSQPPIEFAYPVPSTVDNVTPKINVQAAMNPSTSTMATVCQDVPVDTIP